MLTEGIDSRPQASVLFKNRFRAERSQNQTHAIFSMRLQLLLTSKDPW